MTKDVTFFLSHRGDDDDIDIDDRADFDDFFFDLSCIKTFDDRDCFNDNSFVMHRVDRTQTFFDFWTILDEAGETFFRTRFYCDFVTFLETFFDRDFNFNLFGWEGQRRTL